MAQPSDSFVDKVVCGKKLDSGKTRSGLTISGKEVMVWGGAGVNNKDLVGRRVDRGGGDRGGATVGMREVNITLESNFNEISFFEMLPRPEV